MRLLIHGSETAFHIQQFLPLMEILDEDEDAEYLFFHSTGDLPLQPRNPLMHRLSDVLGTGSDTLETTSRTWTGTGFGRRGAVAPFDSRPRTSLGMSPALR